MKCLEEFYLKLILSVTWVQVVAGFSQTVKTFNSSKSRSLKMSTAADSRCVRPPIILGSNTIPSDGSIISPTTIEYNPHNHHVLAIFRVSRHNEYLLFRTASSISAEYSVEALHGKWGRR
ncbi:hypothetical protein EDB87DRAFT_336800 [Lactarius vividus]|nr:hypothetical protein EDB87DRAFT_336800 [Lactarius vividus]